jgi:hypothetical protein
MNNIFGSAGIPPSAQVCWYVVGVAPGTPPSAFVGGTIAEPVIENMAPYTPFPGTPTSSKFVVSFTGGLVGSAVQFPNAVGDAPTTLGNFLTPANFGTTDYSYPPVVLPTTAGTASLALSALSRNPSINSTGSLQNPPFTKTGGIWIQQLWWVSTQPSSGVLPAGALPGACYNVTHLFTNVGNKDNDGITDTLQVPLNPATIKVSPRSPPAPGQDARDGAFDITINLPRTVTCAPALGAEGEERMPSYANQYGIGSATPKLPLGDSATFAAVPAYGYWVCLLGTIATAGADMTAVRLSDGTLLPGGKPGNSASYDQPFNADQLGQLSQLPLEWPVDVADNNFTYTDGSGAVGGILKWRSTPVNPFPAPGGNPASWYRDVTNPAGLLVLVPPV